MPFKIVFIFALCITHFASANNISFFPKVGVSNLCDLGNTPPTVGILSMTEKYKVYSLNEPNSEIVRYIGITGRELSVRLIDHCKEKGSYPKCTWIKSLKSQNKKPDIVLIEDGLSLDEAKKKERQYILLFKSFGATLKNHTLGGEGVFGYKRTDTERLAMSIRMKERRKAFPELFNSVRKGKPPHNKGKKMSDAQKAKLSEARKKITGWHHSEETKLKIRQGNAGKHSGEKHGTSKFKDSEIPIVRAMYATGKYTFEEIAEVYGVTKYCIIGIVTRYRYKHIA